MDKNFASRCKAVVQDQFSNRNILVRYMRNEQGSPYGVVVVVRDANGRVHVGHSVCNTKKDSFNKYVGSYIAMQRALNNEYNSANANTQDLLNWYNKMYERGQKYWA